MLEKMIIIQSADEAEYRIIVLSRAGDVICTVREVLRMDQLVPLRDEIFARLKGADKVRFFNLTLGRLVTAIKDSRDD